LERVDRAARLTDGQRVYVPRKGQTQIPEVVGPADAPAAAGDPSVSAGEDPAAGDAAQAPVNLNTADAAALDTLPGVGPATARAIIDHRTRNGPFENVDQLLEVKGIGPAKLADLRPHVTV
ncbi:MAG TPA: helix-hairpin-helix domain-containing protein, partial [Candidatus Nanopelagicales bacterium]|nr:helix-hairpin-helix domain-containing protein [Candidatus Nanopelagicales bacterium]